MSVRISTWVWQHSGASGNDLLLMLALADISDDSGRCWPSVAHLAEKTKLSRATVQRRLHALTQEGRIVTRDRAGTSNVYEFRLDSGEYDTREQSDKYLPRPATPLVSQSDTGSELTPVAPSDTGGASPTATGGVAPGATRSVIDPSGTRHGPKRAKPIPKDFTVTDEMRDWAKAKTPPVDVDSETEQFVDHHTAKGSSFKDPVAAWRTWMRNAAKFQAQRGGRSGPEPSRPRFWGDESA